MKNFTNLSQAEHEAFAAKLIAAVEAVAAECGIDCRVGFAGAVFTEHEGSLDFVANVPRELAAHALKVAGKALDKGLGVQTEFVVPRNAFRG